MFRVTRRFTSGILAGLTITQTLRYAPAIGFRCDKPIGGSAYEIVNVEPVE